MARQPSKIMSTDEKKAAQAGLKTALTAHKASIKDINATQTEAAKVFAAAKKTADGNVTAAAKALTQAQKQAVASIKKAEKIFVAASGKTQKALAAAAKGTAKLEAQLAALNSTQPVPVPKAPKLATAMAQASKNIQSLTAMSATAGTA